MANASILAAFERMWQHVASALSKKSDVSHNHNDIYYTESEIDSKVSDINMSIEHFDTHIENTNNPHEVTAEQTGALPITGGTLTGVLYTSASTPLLIGNNGKIGMRAKTDAKNNVGQINISNAWYGNGNQWGSQMSAYNGETGKYNEFRVSHNGMEYFAESENPHQVLHEGNYSTYAVPISRTINGKALTDNVTLSFSDVSADENGAAATAEANAKTYANSTADNKISAYDTAHNTATNTHNDIRVLIADLKEQLENFLDVDDTTVDQLSEVLTLINNNKGTLDSLTTTKVNVSDIVDNLTTNNSDKVLSAAQGVAIKALIDALQGELDTHENNKSNPHGVTKAQVGLGNVDNTSDTNKPVSTAQATAIADAKKAGTDAQTNLNTHVNNKSNPHGVTAAQVGAAPASHTHAISEVTNLQAELNKKAGDFSLELYNGTSGNPKPVKFMTVNYSTCNSENGVAIKVGMVSGHGNGSSYAFLQDAIIKVSSTGAVVVDNFKYYGAATTLDGDRQFGDIFWVIDTTNKVVDFYCLMGQYARLQMTPYKRVTYSSGGTITQYTSCTVYSSGTKVWANNNEFAVKNDIPSLSGYATQSWVQEQIAAIAIYNGSVS